MARALWKGYVTFGLVNIPIELHTAVRDHTPRFRLLHRKDLSPISLERVCRQDGKPVAWGDLVKGYEVEPGRFVAVTEDDFKTAAVERSRSIEILEFVPTAQIDARFWDTPYVIVPAKGAERSYALLSSGRAGIAKYVMRQRQHLAAVQVVDRHLMLTTMRFEEDLLGLPHVPDAQKLPARELALAARLIEGMSSDWEPARYTDDYVSAVLRVINAKAKGLSPTARKASPKEATNVVDLMERLKASLAAAERRPEPGLRASRAAGKRTSRRSAA
jgi:DNA end-binding protein Ku